MSSENTADNKLEDKKEIFIPDKVDKKTDELDDLLEDTKVKDKKKKKFTKKKVPKTKPKMETIMEETKSEVKETESMLPKNMGLAYLIGISGVSYWLYQRYAKKTSSNHTETFTEQPAQQCDLSKFRFM